MPRFRILFGIFSVSAVVWSGVLLGAAMPARAGDLDSPLLLQPRYNIDSNSAPARGTSERTAQTDTGIIERLTAIGLGHCVPIVSSHERQECVTRGTSETDSHFSTASLAEVSGEGVIVMLGEDAQ
jgi:hypothetical protein